MAREKPVSVWQNSCITASKFIGKNKNIMRKDSLTYFADFNPENLPGVANKIEQTVSTLNAIGLDSRIFLASELGLKKHLNLFFSLIRCNSEVILLRTTYYTMQLMFFALFWKRLKGVWIIVEVPTPYVTVWREIDLEWGRSFFGEWSRRVLLLSSMPWSLWPAHKIIQYANDSKYLCFGLNGKTQLHSNGINVSKLKMRNGLRQQDSGKVVLLGLGALAAWHGYDRVILGMANYYAEKSSLQPEVSLILVGDGDICDEWRDLVTQLELNSHVHFVGRKVGTELDLIFEDAHIALSSLALFRLGLEMSSTLKSREYTARGIPFVTTGQDIDFDDSVAFRLNLPNDDSPIDIGYLIDWYSSLDPDKCSPQAMRQYAFERLDFGEKVKKLISPVVGSNA